MSNKDSVYYQAQDILSRRDHSEFELTTKLKKKGFNQEEIGEAIERLRTKKLVNDALLAERYVRSILSTKAVGPKWIESKLRQKRIDTEVIQAAIQEGFDAVGEEDVAKKAAVSWKRQHSRYADDKNRLFRFLMSRGFSSSAISAVTRGD